MKGLLSLAILTGIFSATIQASTINKIEIFPPFLNAGCSTPQLDHFGQYGITLNKLTAKETESKITFSVDETLKVCMLVTDENGNKGRAWKDVNPFTGAEVQYFDVKTSSIKTRLDIIESDSKANRFEVAIINTDNNAKFSSTMINNNVSNTADIEISKLNLLNQNDIDTMDNGQEVKKRVILFNILNVTTYVEDRKLLVGDIPYSGRNVIITFGKIQNKIKMKSLSLK